MSSKDALKPRLMVGGLAGLVDFACVLVGGDVVKRESCRAASSPAKSFAY